MLGHLKWPQSLKSLSVAVDKGKITLCFDRGALTYDSVGFAQKKASSHLVRMIRKALPQQTRNIADIGCGTGYLTEDLQRYYPHAQYDLYDLSQQMLHQAQLKFSDQKNCQFFLKDAETERLQNYDLIVSSMAFQWFNHWQGFVYRNFPVSKLLAFTTLCDGTFKEWGQTFEQKGRPSPILSFPTLETLKSVCMDLNPGCFYHDVMDIPITFHSKKFFMQYLRLLGANACDHRGDLKSFRDVLSDPKPFATHYRVFFAVLCKN